MGSHCLQLHVLSETFAICRLPNDELMPGWAVAGRFYSITRTDDELSIVCPESNVPQSVTCERGWRCMKIDGPLDFSLTGVLASLAGPLADAKVSIFALSTYDTDYLLVRAADLGDATAVLRRNGHEVRAEGT